jgi:hypothetical protein
MHARPGVPVLMRHVCRATSTPTASVTTSGRSLSRTSTSSSTTRTKSMPTESRLSAVTRSVPAKPRAESGFACASKLLKMAVGVEQRRSAKRLERGKVLRKAHRAKQYRERRFLRQQHIDERLERHIKRQIEMQNEKLKEVESKRYLGDYIWR